jgi:hypothetical protein
MLGWLGLLLGRFSGLAWLTIRVDVWTPWCAIKFDIWCWFSSLAYNGTWVPGFAATANTWKFGFAATPATWMSGFAAIPSVRVSVFTVPLAGVWLLGCLLLPVLSWFDRYSHSVRLCIEQPTHPHLTRGGAHPTQPCPLAQCPLSNYPPPLSHIRTLPLSLF